MYKRQGSNLYYFFHHDLCGASHSLTHSHYPPLFVRLHDCVWLCVSEWVRECDSVSLCVFMRLCNEKSLTRYISKYIQVNRHVKLTCFTHYTQTHTHIYFRLLSFYKLTLALIPFQAHLYLCYTENIHRETLCFILNLCSADLSHSFRVKAHNLPYCSWTRRTSPYCNNLGVHMIFLCVTISSSQPQWNNKQGGLFWKRRVHQERRNVFPAADRRMWTGINLKGDYI